MDNPVIGRGWRWPAGVDASGAVALAGGTDDIEQAIYLVLSTTPGERPMRPQFGCNLHLFVFATIDSGMLGLLAHEVRAAISRWEPRARVADVVAAPDDTVEGAVLIEITYTVLDDYDRRSLVVPFYTIPEHEEQYA